MSMALLPGIFQKFQKRADLKENLSSKSETPSLSRNYVGRTGIHLYFDSMEELGH